MAASNFGAGSGFDEQADADIGSLKRADKIGEPVVHAGGVQPAFGGPARHGFPDDAGALRLGRQRTIAKHFVVRAIFQIERGLADWSISTIQISSRIWAGLRANGRYSRRAASAATSAARTSRDDRRAGVAGLATWSILTPGLSGGATLTAAGVFGAD